MRLVSQNLSALFRLSLRASLALCLLGAIPSCEDPPNTQHLPIGSRCADDSSCGTAPYACETAGYPGGYCDKACATNADCPPDSVCAVPHCRRTCDAPTQCRQVEGYTCRTIGATSSFCDLPLSGP